MKKKKKENEPTHKSKSVAALPYGHPFAAAHLLFYPPLRSGSCLSVMKYSEKLRLKSKNERWKT